MNQHVLNTASWVLVVSGQHSPCYRTPAGGPPRGVGCRRRSANAKAARSKVHPLARKGAASAAFCPSAIRQTWMQPCAPPSKHILRRWVAYTSNWHSDPPRHREIGVSARVRLAEQCAGHTCTAAVKQPRAPSRKLTSYARKRDQASRRPIFTMEAPPLMGCVALARRPPGLFMLPLGFPGLSTLMACPPVRRCSLRTGCSVACKRGLLFQLAFLEQLTAALL